MLNWLPSEMNRFWDLSDDPLRLDPPVGLVIGMQADFDIGSKHFPAVRRPPPGRSACQRVGGNGRPEPKDGIAVVIIVRRLDHHEMEQPPCKTRRDKYWFAS